MGRSSEVLKCRHPDWQQRLPGIINACQGDSAPGRANVRILLFLNFPHLVLCVALTPALIYFDRVLLRLDQASDVRCDT